MKTTFGIFVIFAVLATASATKKGDDSLLSALSKERQETKKVIQHENKALRDEYTKLQAEDEKIRKRDEQLQRQIYKMREEKLKDEITQLKKKLRHADRRQRDQIDGFEKKMKELIRQEDVVLETRKREAQTSNSSKKRDAVSEVDITGGSADATSFYSSMPPDYAFVRGKAHAGWNSGNDANNFGIFPQMVWYDFGHGNAFVPARITFKGKANCDDCQKFTPSVWEFVGSNDDVCTGSGNWTVLCQDLSDAAPQKRADTKFCDVNNGDPNVEQSEYRCLGINVIRNYARQIYLSNVRMWKNLIQSGGVKNGTRF